MILNDEERSCHLTTGHDRFLSQFSTAIERFLEYRAYSSVNLIMNGLLRFGDVDVAPK